MFDFAWSEIALIGVVALIAIGPKDMPVAIKAVAEAVKKARRMAGEFQVHVDEMVREANLHEVRDQINDIRRMDIKGKILGAVDGDGTIRKTMSETPFETRPPVTTPTTLTTPPPLTETTVPAAAEHVIAAPEAVPHDAVPAAPATLAALAPAAPASAAPASTAPAMTVPADAHQPSLHD
jgi:sec-independent protein translocase protein TatB